MLDLAMDPSVTLRPAQLHDLPWALELLSAAGLPTRGVGPSLASAYCVAESGGRLVGLAGLEPHGVHGLLRSVVVPPEHRGRGIASALVEDRLQWALRHALEDVYLLTTTAPGYFARLGFLEVARDTVPQAIRQSEEFADVCPQSAIVMMRSIHGP